MVFPHLLWNIIPLRFEYPHDWDYVLYLLKSQGYDDLMNELLDEERKFKKDLEDSLGIIGRAPKLVNPDLAYNEDEEDNEIPAWDRFKLWLNESWNDLKYFCNSCCHKDRKY